MKDPAYRQFIVIPEDSLVDSSITPEIEQAYEWAHRNHRLSGKLNVIMLVVGYSKPVESGAIQELETPGG